MERGGKDWRAKGQVKDLRMESRMVRIPTHTLGDEDNFHFHPEATVCGNTVYARASVAGLLHAASARSARAAVEG
jgi:hypothetical protein